MKLGREPSEITVRSFVIKVDPTSKKKNPAYDALMDLSAELTITIVEHRLPERDDLFLVSSNTSWSPAQVPNTTFEYRAVGPYKEMTSLLKSMKEHARQLSTNIVYNMKRVSGWGGFSNEPEFVYEYVPTEVQCGLCRVKFLHTRLGNYCTCPVCKTEDCCHLTYERPDAAIFPALEVG